MNGLLHAMNATSEPTILYLEVSPHTVHEYRASVYTDWNKVKDDAKNNCSTVKRCFANYLLDAFPVHVECVFGNIRNIPPISALYLLSDMAAFENANLNNLYVLYPIASDRKRFVRNCVRKMEKEFTKAIKNSQNSIDFWWSLVDPDTPEPEWFVKIVKESTKWETSSPIKQQLLKLRAIRPLQYTKIINLYKSVIHTLLTYHSKQTPRRGARNVALSGSITPAIIRDKATMGEYIGVMMTFLQDVYMAAVYGIACKTHVNHIFVVGHLHSAFLSNLLAQKKHAEKQAWVSSDLHITPIDETKNKEFAQDFYPTGFLVDRYLQLPSL
jgi:hypothetical protein